MDKKLIINVNPSETRIALVEDGRVAELFVERQSQQGMVGNIYKGKVTRVLPGMQSAFVNIGTERAAFLYGGDVVDAKYLKNLKENNGKDVDPRSNTNKTPIEKILKEGDEILVQVAKEPLGSKGPRVSMLVTVPGRYVVLMPEFDHVGISRRIEDQELRDRLEKDVNGLRPEGMGLIVRTAAADAQLESLEKDLAYLTRVWSSVGEKKGRRSAPALLYQEPDLILKTCRDLYSDDVAEIIIDDEQAYSQLSHFLQDLIPGADQKLRLHDSGTPLFDYHSLEIDIAKALSRKVWLPSGGSLVIDQTEALTSFDVNTGKYVGSHNARETILKTNLEAAVEIVHQLRVRNIGGIIVIDFIDMEFIEDRQQVNECLEEALKADKSRTNVLAINELGLVQMTRKRTRESLERTLTVPCHYCNGSGRSLSIESVVLDLARDIERFALRTKMKKVQVATRQDVVDRFLNEEKQLFDSLVDRFDLKITLETSKVAVERLEEALYDISGEH